MTEQNWLQDSARTIVVLPPVGYGVEWRLLVGHPAQAVLQPTDQLLLVRPD